MFTVKVGVMPGRLQEVVVENGTTAREIFNLAEVTVSNHEVRLDGDIISMDTQIQEGKLLVAMKQIKGNANTIKVGTMPGKLQELEVAPGETARELFARADISISNHEIRLDGNIIDLDDVVDNGRLLVSMKQIKGNSECVAEAREIMYVSSLTEEEIGILTGSKLPTVLKEEDVDLLDDCVIITDIYLIENDMFFSIYTKREVETEDQFIKSFKALLCSEEGLTGMKLSEEIKIAPVQEEHVCTCKNAIDVINEKIELTKNDLKYYNEIADRKRQDLYILQDVLKDIQ